MHGCYDGYMFFGFNENETDNIIDPDWLYQTYPDIQVFATNVVRNYLGVACYGIRCKTDIVTGMPIISAEEKQKVTEFYNAFVLYKTTMADGKKIKPINLGYYIGISGDFCDEEHYNYTLEEEEDEEEEETAED